MHYPLVVIIMHTPCSAHTCILCYLSCMRLMLLQCQLQYDPKQNAQYRNMLLYEMQLKNNQLWQWVRIPTCTLYCQLSTDTHNEIIKFLKVYQHLPRAQKAPSRCVGSQFDLPGGMMTWQHALDRFLSLFTSLWSSQRSISAKRLVKGNLKRSIC